MMEEMDLQAALQSLKHIPSFPITSGISYKNLPCGMHILCLWSAVPAEVINVQPSAS